MLRRIWVLSTIALLASACSGGGGVGSIGAVLGRDNETRSLYVREVPEGGAAEAAGLREGDRVMMIDGHYVGDLSRAGIQERLRGDAGTQVSLTFLRGNDVHHVTIVRRTLTLGSARRQKEEMITP